MSMQMSQQQLQQQQMSGGPMGGGPMSSMGFGQQQHMSVNGGPNYSQQQQQQPMNVKLSQSQSQSMCLGSNSFTMKNGGMAISNNNTGSGGTLIQSSANNSQQQQQHQLHLQHQELQHQQHQQQTHLINPSNMKSEIMSSQSDFNFDLLDNIGSGDPSGYGSDASDFLNSFDASSNYQNILDSL